MKLWKVSVQGIELAQYLMNTRHKEKHTMTTDYLVLAVQKMDQAIERLKQKKSVMLLRTDYLE